MIEMMIFMCYCQQEYRSHSFNYHIIHVRADDYPFLIPFGETRIPIPPTYLIVTLTRL